MAWQGDRVSDDVVDPAGWLTVPEVAERLDVPVTKVRQMIRDRALLAVRRDGVLRIPAELVAGSNVIKHLPGVLTLLFDAGYTDIEAMRWLYTVDPSLPGTPIQALTGQLATEVKRRAQALGY
jgi:excisionase family DNA binding protein